MDQPYFEISVVSSDGNETRLSGFFSSLTGVGIGDLYLLSPAGQLIEGKLSDLTVEDRQAVFSYADSAIGTGFVAGQRCRYFDAYWGPRAEIVLDNARRWQRTRFVATDAVMVRATGVVMLRKVDDAAIAEGPDVKIVSGGWDHEHCAIDWKHIGTRENPDGYRDQDGEWVCEECYEKYVLTRSLDFIAEY